MPKFGEAIQSKMKGDKFDVKDYDYTGGDQKKYTYFYTKGELE